MADAGGSNSGGPAGSGASPTFDVVIVGGGTAGCVAATRLTEDPNRRVLLLEAGPDPWPLPEIVGNAKMQNRLLMESDYLTVVPTRRHADGSEYYSLAGRIMGGGSSVNVMSVIRPQRADLDGWAARGNPDWTYERCLPFMRAIESDQEFTDPALHGTTGPLFVRRGFTLDDQMSPPVQAFLDAAYALGLPRCPDLSVADPYGVAVSPYNIRDGRRQSATVAYLALARERPNLTIVDRASALGLRFDAAGRRVTGVEYERDGALHTASGDQVVLAAGVYGTAKLLMLSGVGPADELGRHGIAVRHELPGVGRNYQDHAVVYATFEGKQSFDTTWVVPRFRLITRHHPMTDAPNFHINMRAPTKVVGLKPLLPVSAHLLEQRGEGRVRLSSADPGDPVEIDSGMLEHQDDVRAMVEALRFVDELVHQPGLTDEWYGPLVTPEADEDWAEFARRTYDSYHHGVGTCRMGPAWDPLTVVDQGLRVHGLDNLWIGDASIMPSVTRANTNLTAMLIGERLADFVVQMG